MKNKKNIYFRDIREKDLDEYQRLINPKADFHKCNAPYFKKMNNQELSLYIETLKKRIEIGEEAILEDKQLIIEKGTEEILGEVNWYWKSKETLWMEIGIVIFEERHRGGGLGYITMKKWVNQVFQDNPKIVRLGLSTWSGNTAMIRLAKKLGFTQEARYKNARIVNGEYFDSLSYGMLRNQWENI